MTIALKRAYDSVSRTDGRRFLVERLWPRGVSKAKLRVEAWLKEVGPSTELRQWFSHDPGKWSEFRRRYFRELDSRPEAWQPIDDHSDPSSFEESPGWWVSSDNQARRRRRAALAYRQVDGPAVDRDHTPVRRAIPSINQIPWATTQRPHGEIEAEGWYRSQHEAG